MQRRHGIADGRMAFDGEYFYVSDAGGIYKLSQSGERLAYFKIKDYNGRYVSEFYLNSENNFVCFDTYDYPFCISNDGDSSFQDMLWKNESIDDLDAMACDGTLGFVVSGFNYIASFDPLTGAEIWRRFHSDQEWNFYGNRGLATECNVNCVVATATAGMYGAILVAMSKDTGDILWQTDFTESMRKQPYIGLDGKIYFYKDYFSFSGLYRIDPETGSYETVLEQDFYFQNMDIDVNGNIYLLESYKFKKIAPDGTILFDISHDGDTDFNYIMGV